MASLGRNIDFSESKRQLTACGCGVDDPEISVNYKEQIIYFCEKECLDEFNVSPEKFIDSDHFLISFNEEPKEKAKAGRTQINSNNILAKY